MILVAMGSESDWETLQHSADTLRLLKIPYRARVLSAHRTPERMLEAAARAAEEGFRAIIAGAGGAAHLPGMMASATLLPVIGVPVTSRALNGMDSLLSIVQMPAGVPVATMAIGKAGAVNAALMVARLLAVTDEAVRERLQEYRQAMQEKVLEQDGRVGAWPLE